MFLYSFNIESGIHTTKRDRNGVISWNFRGREEIYFTHTLNWIELNGIKF